jgi:hypothetical protein
MSEFKDRFTVIPDTRTTQLLCNPCNVVIWRSYHPSLDVLIEQARAHNLAEHA